MKKMLKVLSVLQIIIGILGIAVGISTLGLGRLMESAVELPKEQEALILMMVSAVLGLISSVFNFCCGFYGFKGAKGNKKSLSLAVKLGYIGLFAALVSGVLTLFGDADIERVCTVAASSIVPILFLVSAKGVKAQNLTLIAAIIIFICPLSLTGCKKEEKQKTEVIVKSEGQMEGVLVSFGGSTLVVEEAGESYTFDVSDASIQTKNMRAGDELIINFEGKLKDKDTSKVKVISVEDLGENSHQTEKQAVGTLVNLTENTITIRQNDGKELLFNSNNCQHEFRNGIREGNWIVVTYIGEIKGTDTKNVAVIKITDNAPNIVQEEQKEMNIKAVNETVYATAGVHIRESYTTESKVLGTLPKGNSIVRTGVCENGWSRVQYESKDAYIYGEYLTTEKPKEDAPAAKTNGKPPATPQKGNEPQPVVQQPEEKQPQEAQQPEEEKQPQEAQQPEEEKQPQEAQQPEEENQPQEAQQPEEENQPQELQEQSFTGVVLEVTMNTITVAAREQEYILNIADAEHMYANGIQRGNKVTVTYAGSLEEPDNLIVIRVQDSNPNDATENAQYEGAVVDATMNTLTIETEDGAVMTFIKEGAVNNIDGTLNGMRVKITADMADSETDENIFQAKQIDPADGE